MAANYWDSTQRTHWTFTKDQLDDIRTQQQQDNQELHSRFPLPEPRLMNIYIQQRASVDIPKVVIQLIASCRNNKTWP
jgi:cyclin C